MITTNIRNTRYHHNGDFSGDTTIQCGDKEIVIPTEDILDFVARIIADKRIAALEQSTYQDIFGIQL